jgi:hypothetical protein
MHPQWYKPAVHCTSRTSAVQGSPELEALQQGQVDSSTMQFIDFEYGSYNYRGYDFANNWCEYAGFEGDYSRYPDEKQQALFVTNYLQQQGNSSPVRPLLCYNAARLTSAKADTWAAKVWFAMTPDRWPFHLCQLLLKIAASGFVLCLSQDVYTE